MKELEYATFEYPTKKTREAKGDIMIQEPDSILNTGELGVEDDAKWEGYHQKKERVG